MEDTNELLKQSLILSKTGLIESAEATQLLTSTLNGFKLEAQDAAHVVDVLNHLDMVSATSAQELAVALSRTANSAQDAGMSFEQLTAWITTTSETTRRSASSIGEAYKTISARLKIRFVSLISQSSFIGNYEGEFSLTVWNPLKPIKLQRKDEISLNVNVTKVEKINWMTYGEIKAA